MKIILPALLGALVLAAPLAAAAAPMKVSAELSAKAETPPNSSSGTGTLDGTFDPQSKVLTYTATYSGLTGPATMAHFHGPAPKGAAAPVEIPVTSNLASPIKGTVTLTDDQAKNLTDGMTYFNIHTAANKKGEIRGQVSVAK